jgi:hypothetical protein
LTLCALLASASPALAGDLPDPVKTPGLADPQLTQARLCRRTFHTGTVRAVDASLKKKVYASYGMSPTSPPCPCEVDHLVSLEIGGANDQKNLWPQSYGTKPWDAHIKDQLENRLHHLVCTGRISLADAQHEIATNWIAAYQQWMPSSNPRSRINKRWQPSP